MTLKLKNPNSKCMWIRYWNWKTIIHARLWTS